MILESGRDHPAVGGASVTDVDAGVTSLEPALIEQVLAWVDRLPTGNGRRAAILGDARPWAELLARRGYQVLPALRDPADPALAEAEGAIDLAIVVGVLEHEAWDRWTLQRLHRALADGGHLIVAVPNLRALTGPGDLAFLSGRVARELRNRTRRALGLAPAREAFRGRRYREEDVERTLATLGYLVRDRAAFGHGWIAPVAARSSRFGADPRRPFPDAAEHRARFERTHRAFLDERTRWLAAHPRFRPQMVAAFDPSLFRGRHALVLAPHPDDELIGCGGTLVRLIAGGARVTVVQATDGSEAASLWNAPDAVRRTVRLDEARAVGAALGFESVICWNEDNAAFRDRPERVAELAALLARLEPALVFTPFVTDVHPDHRVLSGMLAKAIAREPGAMRDARVLSYQVWSLVPPNLYCDVTAEMEAIERALWRYDTAMKVDDYVHFCLDRNYHDATEYSGRPGFVEAYFEMPAASYGELAATAGGERG
jgi:LmbE family N-acetylglucosaminyl deacetylase/SAM-dependent methyltransferase